MSRGSASPPEGEHDTLLRFIACGSVDDGKSTLIGRLIHDTHSVGEDQLARLADDSRRFGTRGSEVDFALLLDGLAAEREQGITIDVAHRFFATERRRFIVADAPGHEQFTRNMVTGASNADAALILIDVREGPVTQTRRHSHLAHLLGIRHFLLAVNKLDLVDYNQAAFEAAVAAYLDFARTAGLGSVEAVPVCAIHGDNVTTRSEKMDWYTGPTIVEHLERLPTRTVQERDAPFRMPVQWVNRPNADFRGYAGTVASGTVRPGDQVHVSGRTTRIADIVTYDGPRNQAAACDAVTLVLADQIDCSRGDLIASSSAPPQIGEVFEATIIWMIEQEMLPGRSYLLKIGPNIVAAQLQAPKYELDPNTLEHRPARTLSLNAIGVCNLTTDRPIAWAPYAENRDLGGFLLIDRETNATAGAGLFHFALRRSDNVRWQALDVTREMHAGLKHQRPALLWFTGLSGAGKSTVANLVEKKLVALGRHTFLLDGDNLRHGLNKDLGFTDADRVENIRRAGEVAKLMTDAGLIVLAAFISPFRAERRMVREMVQAGEFVEIFVDTPLEVAEERDVKGLYRKARAGELANFTGIGSPYEAPEAPEIRIDTTGMSPEAAADRIVDWLLQREARA